MSIKIIIGTIAFMMTMMVLGFATLREPARMERFTGADLGRSTEAGAHIFVSNCATCHGLEGKAENCYDANGNQIACQGLPLNYNQLLCGDVSPRMAAMGWTGTKYNYILTTVSAGRGSIMPTWSEQFGGPLRPDQIRNVTDYVLNWEDEALCAAPLVTYEWPETVVEFLDSPDVTAGDPANGEQLYSVTYGCAGCHGQTDNEDSAIVGPWLGNIAEIGGTMVEGQDAPQYVYHSILYPSDFIVPECPTGPCTGPPSLMPANFALRMGENPQDMADILSYLLGTQ